MIFTIKIWIADIPSSDIKVHVELVKLVLLHVTLLVRSLRKHYHQNIGIIKKITGNFHGFENLQVEKFVPWKIENLLVKSMSDKGENLTRPLSFLIFSLPSFLHLPYISFFFLIGLLVSYLVDVLKDMISSAVRSQGSSKLRRRFLPTILFQLFAYDL